MLHEISRRLKARLKLPSNCPQKLPTHLSWHLHWVRAEGQQDVGHRDGDRVAVHHQEAEGRGVVQDERRAEEVLRIHTVNQHVAGDMHLEGVRGRIRKA